MRVEITEEFGNSSRFRFHKHKYCETLCLLSCLNFIFLCQHFWDDKFYELRHMCLVQNVVWWFKFNSFKNSYQITIKYILTLIGTFIYQKLHAPKSDKRLRRKSAPDQMSSPPTHFRGFVFVSVSAYYVL